MLRRMMWFGAILLVAAVTFTGTALAEIGQIKTLKGDVVILRDGQRLEAKAGDLLQQADVIETGKKASVGITFIDNSRFAAGPETRIALKEFRFNPTTHEGTFAADLDRGTLTVISGQMAKQSPDAMSIRTPTTILGLRGTRLAVQVME